MCSLMLRTVRLCLCLGFWTVAGVFMARATGVEARHGAVAFGVAGLLLFASAEMARKRATTRPTGVSVPGPTRVIPAPDPKDYHKEAIHMAENGVTIDDFLERWRGQAPPSTRTKTVGSRDVLISTPPYGSHRSRLSSQALRKMAEIHLKMQSSLPRVVAVQNLRPAAFRWVRVNGAGPVGEVVGPGVESRVWKVHWATGGVEEHSKDVLVQAYPKKGEYWWQQACRSCNISGPSEICFMADGTLHGRVACGCLNPINSGYGRRP